MLTHQKTTTAKQKCSFAATVDPRRNSLPILDELEEEIEFKHRYHSNDKQNQSIINMCQEKIELLENKNTLIDKKLDLHLETQLKFYKSLQKNALRQKMSDDTHYSKIDQSIGVLQKK